MSWQPVAEGVQQIVAVLENTQNTSLEVQKQILAVWHLISFCFVKLIDIGL